MTTRHSFFKYVCFTLVVGVLSVSSSLGYDIQSNADIESKVKTSKNLTKKALRMIEQGHEIAAAGEMLNESIRINASVSNLEVKGDQYAKLEMKNNALYFYQKALELGLQNNPKFDARSIQKKILKIQPNSSYLMALADKHILEGSTEEALNVYLQILQEAQSKKQAKLMKDVQNRIVHIQ